MDKIILLNKVLGRNIILRRSMVELFERINNIKKSDIFIDFKDIGFISRSSAAEYLKLREGSDKRIIEKNMSEEVKSMFRLVEKQFRKVNFIFTKETPMENVKAH